MNSYRILLNLGVLALVVCMAASQATAYDIVEFPICTDTNAQLHPAISGNIVVWHDYRTGNPDIYGYDLLNNNEFPICEDTNNQYGPEIKGNIVVWSDRRNGNSGIYGYDLLNNSEFPICTDANGQYLPTISGNIVVWQDYRNGMLTWNADIYGYDLARPAEFAITTDTNEQRIPAISGSIVLWADNRNGNTDIYGYDLFDHNEFAICTDTNDQWNPAISGNIVVWTDQRNVNYDIYGYDLVTNTNFPICTDTNEQDYPAISGNIVVWEDFRNDNYDIYGYDLLTQTKFPISTHTNNQRFPAISGNVVVWIDERNGNQDIYGAYILPPAHHDKCENAVPVEVNFPYYGSTVGSTGVNLSWCGVGDDKDVWHTLAPVDGNYTISLCGSDFNTTLAVFDACPLDANELACNDNNDLCGSGSPQSQLQVSLQAGRTYYIRVSGAFDDPVGNYVLKVTGPKCTTAIAGDVTNDCKVDFKDVAILALDWLDCKLDPPEACWE